jgi:hypothetical protein
MVVGLQNDDFELWAAGVQKGLPQCRELLIQQKESIARLKELEGSE